MEDMNKGNCIKTPTLPSQVVSTTKPVLQSVSKSMRGNRSTGTLPERILAKMAWNAGYRGYRKNDRRIPGKPDLYFPRLKLAVLLNGCFWHRCPYCKLPLPKSNTVFWDKKFAMNKERDKRQRKLRNAADIRTFVVWECRLIKDPDRVLERLGRVVIEQEERVRR